MASEVQQLRARVHILTTLVSQNGISVPSEFTNEETSPHRTLHTHVGNLTIEQTQTATRAQAQDDSQVEFASKSANQSSAPSGDVFSLRHHGSRYFRRPRPLVPTTTITLSAELSDKTHLCELDTTTVGMEFVLTYAFFFSFFTPLYE